LVEHPDGPSDRRGDGRSFETPRRQRYGAEDQDGVEHEIDKLKVTGRL